jgi:hypothetical protein
MVKFSTRSIFLVAVAAVSGIVVLAGYFIQTPLLSSLGRVFLQWASILFAALLLVGVLNLGRSHIHKIAGRKAGWPYSLALLAALVITLVTGLIFSPSGSQTRWIFNYIQLPVEASLLAVLAVILVYTSARMLGRRLDLYSIIFLTVLLFTLFASVTLFQAKIPALAKIYDWIVQVWAVGGGRGLLLGIALGVIATGLRAIFGADRPYEP